MSVYFLGAGDLIKIGYSRDVKKRTDAILSSFKDGQLLGFIPGDRSLEKHFHKKFAAHHSHGEWFKKHPDIEGVISLCGIKDTPEADRKSDRTLLDTLEEKHLEDAADCIHAALHSLSTRPDTAFRKFAEWSGIEDHRLREIYEGVAVRITAGEYTICRSLGQSAGFDPSPTLDR